MKNIFTKQFRHFFLILFAVLLILQLLGSGTFIITKTKQLLFTVFITSCLTSIFSYSRIYFYNYLLALLPLLSLLPLLLPPQAVRLMQASAAASTAAV